MIHYIIYNIIGKKKKEEDRKITRSLCISGSVWYSAMKYAHFMECSTSILVEKAVMEYMVNHASELPVTASFTLAPIPEKPKECEFKDCREPAIACGSWRNRIEILLCEKHLAEAKDKPADWKILSEV